MHSYLKTVGFSDIARKEMDELIKDTILHYDRKYVAEGERHGVFVEFSKNYSIDSGISVCGEIEEDGSFRFEYYYPFFRGSEVTTQEKLTVERYADKESFAGACDDMRVGITLIFFLQNSAEYMKIGERRSEMHKPVILTGLADEGKILFPVQKDKELVRIEQEAVKNRNDLLEAARNGDEEAMESLTMEEMDTYSMLSKRIEKEDIMTIVDSCFMPYGIECDRYGILGEIREFSWQTNEKTQERLCRLTVECNDIPFAVLINEKNLLGEPAVGRRFKGNIWLQGQILY